MTIQEKVKDDLKAAMIANDMAKKSILRVLIGEFNRIDKTLSDEQATSVLKKMVQNAIDQQNALEERILNEYLPQQLTTDQLSMLISQLIEDKGYSSIKDMGKIMADLKKEYAGRYDGKVANELIKSRLV